MKKLCLKSRLSSLTPVAVANVGVVAIGTQVDGSLSLWGGKNCFFLYRRLNVGNCFMKGRAATEILSVSLIKRIFNEFSAITKLLLPFDPDLS